MTFFGDLSLDPLRHRRCFPIYEKVERLACFSPEVLFLLVPYFFALFSPSHVDNLWKYSIQNFFSTSVGFFFDIVLSQDESDLNLILIHPSLPIIHPCLPLLLCLGSFAALPPPTLGKLRLVIHMSPPCPRTSLFGHRLNFSIIDPTDPPV